MYKAVILVVDDEQIYLDSITETLKGKNYKILQALNGKMGIQVTRKFLPDIIITDWEMPEMSGLDMILQLKSDELTRDIPIIMCTGIMTTSENLYTALQAGAADYLRKPPEPIELIARINSALNLSAAFKKIKAQNIELQTLNHTKDNFFSIISHDLRGPFGGMMNLTEMLLVNIKKYNTEEIEKLLTLVFNSAKNAYNLSENLLSWSKCQMNLIEFNCEKIDLGKTINEVFVTLENQANTKNILLLWDNTSNIELFTDRNILKTILRNLITNAIKFTHSSGKVMVEAKQDASQVEIAVIDYGIGMNDDQKNRLFKINDKYTQKGTNGELGTGLGLILCKEFIEKLGGKIWVESEKDKGSRFMFSLPVQKENEQIN